jgi:dihydrodipicolinate synthase/N-acetylneuraminate lyase
MLTAHIYREGKYNRDTKQTAALAQAAHTLAADFTSTFTPYALSSFSETDRVTHFRDLAAAATELGVWLFAQPCTFEFVWTKSQTELTTVPRVLKTYDEQGNRLATAQVLVEGERVAFRR